MKAVTLVKYGAPLTWADLPTPTPQAGEVLVKVHAASINPLDSLIQRGAIKSLYSYKLRQIMGNDLAGTVEQVGPGVTDFQVGDEVFARPAMERLGAFAEYCIVRAADLAHKPRNISAIEAAALPLVSLTALQAFTEKTNVGPGTKVFIQGGAGGLGSIALQVAKMLGATVAVTVGTADVQFARELGADIVVDYKTQKYEEHVKDFDVVLDTLGGAEIERSMKVLRKGGIIVSVIGNPDAELANQLGKPFLKPIFHFLSRKERASARKAGVTYKFLFMRADGAQLTRIAEAVDAAQLKPIVGNVLPFDELVSALNNPSEKKTGPGKTVVEIAAQ